MQVQLKVVLLVALTVAGVVSAVAWKTSEQIRKESSSLAGEAGEKQLPLVRRLVQSKLDLAKDQLVQFARRREAGGGTSMGFSDFDVVSLAFESDNKNWAAKWTEKRPDAKSSRWAGSREQVLLRSLPFTKLKDGETHWVWRLDKQDGAVFALMVPVQVEASSGNAAATMTEALPESTTENANGSRRGIVVGFFSENPLAVVTEDFIGASQTAYVVDDQGYVASHSKKDYNGSLFSEDDIVKEIKRASKVAGNGTYENLDGQKVAGRWERVEGTNLYAVVTTPSGAASGASHDVLQAMLLIGGGGTFLAVLIALLVGSRMSSSIRDVEKFAIEWQAGNFQPGLLDTRRADEIGDLARALAKLNGALPEPTPKDERAPAPVPAPAAPAPVAAPSEETYRQLAHGLSGSMRAPLAAILGNVQLLRAKTAGGDGDQHAASIERDARALKTVVDALTRIAGDESVELKPARPNEILEIAMAGMDRELTVSGVQVVIEADEVPLINASPLHLQAALEALCRQSAHAMRTRPAKELRLRLSQTGEGKIRLVIRDMGLGLDREELDRYFEPFHQGYAGAPNPGLGLAMARALLERHMAEVIVDSVPGQGTTVSIDFPKSAQQTLPQATAAAKTPPPPRPELRPPPPVAGLSAAASASPPPRAPEPPPLPKTAMAPPPPTAKPAAPAPPVKPPPILGGKAAVVDESGNFPPAPGLEGFSEAFDLSKVDPNLAADMSALKTMGGEASSPSKDETEVETMRDDHGSLSLPDPSTLEFSLDDAQGAFPEPPPVEAPSLARTRGGEMRELSMPQYQLDDSNAAEPAIDDGPSEAMDVAFPQPSIRADEDDVPNAFDEAEHGIPSTADLQLDGGDGSITPPPRMQAVSAFPPPPAIAPPSDTGDLDDRTFVTNSGRAGSYKDAESSVSEPDSDPSIHFGSQADGERLNIDVPASFLDEDDDDDHDAFSSMDLASTASRLSEDEPVARLSERDNEQIEDAGDFAMVTPATASAQMAQVNTSPSLGGSESGGTGSFKVKIRRPKTRG